MQENYIEIEGIRTRYIDIGEGKVVLLLHGWMGSSIDFPTLLPMISKKFRAVALDLPGFGESNRMSIEPTLESYAAFVEKFLIKMKIDNCCLVGNCWGGSIGLTLAASSQKIQRLVVFTPITNPHQIKNWVRGVVRVFGFPTFLNFATFLVGRKIFMKFLLFIFFGRRPKRYNEQALQKKQQADLNNAFLIARDLTQYPSSLTRINQPIMLITFASDVFLREEKIVHDLRVISPSLFLKRIESGHLSNPEELISEYNSIVEFLSS